MTIWVLVILWVSAEKGPGMDIGLYPSKDACLIEVARDEAERQAKGDTGPVLSVCHPAKASWVSM